MFIVNKLSTKMKWQNGIFETDRAAKLPADTHFLDGLKMDKSLHPNYFSLHFFLRKKTSGTKIRHCKNKYEYKLSGVMELSVWGGVRGGGFDEEDFS